MKKIITLLVTIIGIHGYTQEPVDIVAPQQGDFNAGQNIEGWVQSSINEPTGKVTFSVPLASINARTVSYNVPLTYNGQSSFDIGSYTNKFATTSVVGVGFNLHIPKIVVDHKNTATREDDEFYLQDGVNNTKLHCIKRTEPGNFQTGETIWEFQTDVYVPWKIKYYKSLREQVNGVLTETPLDYWMVTNDQGIDYLYGQTQNSRENMVAWGNWIGNSNKPGGTKETIVWNLSTMRDQWNNNIQFEYEKQESTIGGISQTEASYLNKIISSTGEHIQFSYNDKNLNEYYEPHAEQAEPDGYQERYEKKYLDRIINYNSNNEIIFSYSFDYTLVNNSSSSDKKRYLKNIFQEDKNGNLLPAQSFDYYMNGPFKGGIQKVTYPMGGSVTYTYENKLLFNNTANNFTGSIPTNNDYNFYSIATKDNYAIMLLKSKNPISGGKYRFRVIRNWWNGQSWEQSAFTLPYLIADDYPNGRNWLENFHTVFGKDFYGFLYVQGGNLKSRVDLFHLNSNKVSWNHEHYDDLILALPNTLGSNYKTAFLSGDRFVAVSDGARSNLHTFAWDGTKWIRDRVHPQNGGVLSYYYHGASNNFILTVDDRNVGIGANHRDFITGKRHKDYYYIHYLNNQNQWVSKSWSAIINPHTNNIEKASYFYPDNAMSAFVADHNAEFFMNWDKEYNLKSLDASLGSQNDKFPIVPTYSGMFVLQEDYTQKPIKFSRYNGASWNIQNFSFSGGSGRPSYGDDIMTFENFSGSNYYIGYAKYNANSDNWIINNTLTTRVPSPDKTSGITKDFLIANNKIYKFSNTSLTPIYDHTLSSDNKFTYTDGYNHAFMELGPLSPISDRTGTFQYVDMTNNDIKTINLGKKYHLSGPTPFAGRTPFMSPKSMWIRTFNNRYLYRIIDNKVNNAVRNIVVSRIDINDDNGEIRKISYAYDDPNSDPDNTATFYGDVTIENKGYGSTSIGKIEKKYNNGANDLQMAGLLLQERIRNTANSSVSLKINTWTKFDELSKGYTIKLTKQLNHTYLNGKTLRNSVENIYTLKPYILRTNVKRTNSKGETEEVITKYAYEQYPFMEEFNFVTHPYEIVRKIDNRTTSIKRTHWTKNISNKIYASEIWSGTSTSNLRLSYKVSKMSQFGQILESHNGKFQYNSVVYGYNHRYPIYSLSNVRYDDVIHNLDVSLSTLQNLNNTSLKTELLKLYDRLPNCMIETNLYDGEGKIIEKINNRQEEIKYKYDSFNRLDYVTDHNDKVLKKNFYNYGSN